MSLFTHRPQPQDIREGFPRFRGPIVAPRRSERQHWLAGQPARLVPAITPNHSPRRRAAC